MPDAQYLPRHLLLLIDGTWVSASRVPAGAQQSNIYWLNLFVNPWNKESEAEITFYIAGIGSVTEGARWSGGIFGY